MESMLQPYNYYLNRNPQKDGFRIVHRDDCEWMYLVKDPVALGLFVSPDNAVKKARRHYDQARMCLYCSPSGDGSRIDAKRVWEVLKLIDMGSGYSNSVTNCERKWCAERGLVKGSEGENGPILTLTDCGMWMLCHWSRIYGDKQDEVRE